MVEPQVCRTAVMPMWAPRCLGSAAIVSTVSAEALRQVVDDRLVLVGDIGDRTRQCEHDVKVATGNSSASRSASHSLAAAPWHGQCRLRQLL